ncbi:hypothetical protein R3P38DRAFT_1745592 [Favolaschia claudopus]|uniref:Uncharacterized protein n=1 Tax=Favolaschia claudopus TaxID=2862362 RepID=A0AAW0DFJ3_9AGAR
MLTASPRAHRRTQVLTRSIGDSAPCSVSVPTPESRKSERNWKLPCFWLVLRVGLPFSPTFNSPRNASKCLLSLRARSQAPLTPPLQAARLLSSILGPLFQGRHAAPLRVSFRSFRIGPENDDCLRTIILLGRVSVSDLNLCLGLKEEEKIVLHTLVTSDRTSAPTTPNPISEPQLPLPLVRSSHIEAAQHKFRVAVTYHES